MIVLNLVLGAIAIISGTVGAMLWYKASTVTVAPDPDSCDFQMTEVFDDGRPPIDILTTATAQTKWNKRAAISTSIAALSQTAAFVVQTFLL
tara:strand:+ start:822 stop:1097 length:276 start_codon:yes stop_codon:yes gene_type:complete